MFDKLSALKDFATDNRGTIGLLVGVNLGSYLTWKAARAQREWYEFLLEEGVFDAINEAKKEDPSHS